MGLPRYNFKNRKTWMSCKSQVFCFLEKPRTKLSIAYYLFSLVLVLVSLVMSVLSTISTVESFGHFITKVYTYEIILWTLSSLELFARMIVCDTNIKYRGFYGRLRFIRSFSILVDIFIIATAFIIFVQPNNHHHASFAVLRFNRFLQIFRILRLDRQNGNLTIMWKVVCVHKKELITCYFICFIILFSGAYLLYLIETNIETNTEAADGQVENMANGLYWGIVTFTSVGYGDYTPQSWPAKAITSVFAIIGVAFFSLPAGIIGSGFALQVAKQRKEKRFVKVRNPAAILIQTVWRSYAINRDLLQASWFYLLPQLAIFHEYKLLEDVCEPTRGDYSKKSIATRKEEDSRKKTVLDSLWNRQKQGSTDTLSDKDRDGLVPITSLLGVADISDHLSTMQSAPLSSQILRKYQIAVQTIMLLKLKSMVSMFRNVRQPYVNVESLLQKNSLNAVEALSRLSGLAAQFDGIVKDIKCLKMELRELKEEK